MISAMTWKRWRRLKFNCSLPHSFISEMLLVQLMSGQMGSVKTQFNQCFYLAFISLANNNNKCLVLRLNISIQNENCTIC